MPVKLKEFKPVDGSVMSVCSKCSTKVWLSPEEQEVKNKDKREVWCADCSVSFYQEEDDLYIHKMDKEAYLTLEPKMFEEAWKDHENVLSELSKNLPDLCKTAMGCMDPMENNGHLILCAALRTFVENLLYRRRNILKKTDKEATVGDVLDEYGEEESKAILSFIFGVSKAAGEFQRRCELEEKTGYKETWSWNASNEL